MLTPSEIALLRRDLKTALRVIGIDEFDDAVQVLEEHGYQLGEFEVEECSQELGQGIAPIAGAITWTHKRSGVSRTYSVGHGSTWLMAFNRDLKRKVFLRAGARLIAAGLRAARTRDLTDARRRARARALADELSRTADRARLISSARQ